MITAALLLAAAVNVPAPVLSPVRFSPSQPRVGDLITVDFRLQPGSSISVDGGGDLEVVSVTNGRAVVRSFRPGKAVARGTIVREGVRMRFEGPEIPIVSVLGPGDDLAPSPLIPPRPIPRARAAIPVTLAAAGAAAAAWAGLIWLLGRRVELPLTESSAVERYLAFVGGFAGRPLTQQDLIALADGGRDFLSHVDEGRMGRELTTRELLSILAVRGVAPPVVESIREVLHEGDLAKFSPWGSPLAGTDAVIEPARKVAGVAGGGSQ
jgi:hypothetical protein